MYVCVSVCMCDSVYILYDSVRVCVHVCFQNCCDVWDNYATQYDVM